MNPPHPRPRGTAEQCAHLAVEHDTSTCLAYASPWNCCHRASPPESVELTHQGKYCLTALHEECPVFRSGKTGPLPAGIGAADPTLLGRFRGRGRLPGFLAALVLALGLLLWLGMPTPSTEATAEFHAGAPLSGTAAPTLEPVLAATDWALPTMSAGLASAANPTPGGIEMPGGVGDPGNSSSAIPSASAPSRLCGHDLDEPFGNGRQFLIHRVKPGESLDNYAATYRTTPAAIQGVNAEPVLPLHEDQIIVIPLNQKEIDEVPMFEAYELSERNTTAGRVAEMLASTDLNEFLLYNGISTTCPIFSGWVLAPRERTAP